MTQGSLPRSFKVIRVGCPVVDHVDRSPSKINESWVNFFSMQNLKCIRWVKMKPMTQGKLPRSFKAIRLARGKIFDGRRRGSPRSATLKNQSPMGQIFFYGKCHVLMLRKNYPYDTRKPPKKFQGNPSRSPSGRQRGSPSIKNQWAVGQLFFYAKSKVHMLVQNEAYDTRKPPKKFQGNSTSARPNLRWTTTWIAIGSLLRSFKAIRVGRPAVDHVDRHPSKINESWVKLFFYAKSNVHMLGQNKAYDTRKPPKKLYRIPTCARPNLRWTMTWKPPKKFHGDSSGSPGRRPRGSPSIKNLSVEGQLFFYAKFKVHTLVQNEAYDTRKPPKKFQGYLTCPWPNLRWTATWIAVSLPRSHVHMLRKNDPYDTRKPPKMFQADSSRSPGGRPRGSPSIKNQ
ncbi:uncharacterized protein G2W53_026953 [Senna tora]|uniref:Uncharacterized protein n=1 Tax=Senna tora TaxID=362788 RepID=A0A834TGA2_9FABA|nr:uncharacterized protein G2W53_026953 [Senna tora]